jgi:general secretion pathway protein A
MYKTFFQLARNPFDLVPDPKCFVSTKPHNEALAALYYGVRWHKGFIVVTGEVGTGKTLLLRCLLRLLQESKDIAYAYLFNSRLTADDLLHYIAVDFGLSTEGKSKAGLLFEFGRFLTGRAEQGLTTVLIIDEAHQLPEETLEEVRLLSNLETAEDKLLQIVLVGQPELEEKLDSVALRQLKQRIAIRAALGSLDARQTREYIEQRMQIAGSGERATAIFPLEAIAAIYHYSRGLPRLINCISENALIAAYSRQSPSVTAEMVAQVAKSFRLEPGAAGMPTREAMEFRPADELRRSPLAESLRSVNGGLRGGDDPVALYGKGSVGR